MGFFDDIEEDFAESKSSEPATTDETVETDSEKIELNYDDKMENQYPKQKIIVKKLNAHVSSNAQITENAGGEPGIVEIPDGWIVKQITTTPLLRNGETRHIVITMLLEQR